MSKNIVFKAYNLNMQVMVARHVEFAAKPWQRLRGLLGRRSLAPQEGLLIHPCSAVHSWFMAFPFDVIFLDHQFTVVHLIESMPPFRCSPLVSKARYALELSAGMARWSGTKIGDQFAFQKEEGLLSACQVAHERFGRV